MNSVRTHAAHYLWSMWKIKEIRHDLLKENNHMVSVLLQC